MVCIVRLPVNVNVHSMFCNSWVVVDFVFVDEGEWVRCRLKFCAIESWSDCRLFRVMADVARLMADVASTNVHTQMSMTSFSHECLLRKYSSQCDVLDPLMGIGRYWQ